MDNQTSNFSNSIPKFKKRKTSKKHTYSCLKLWHVEWPFSINFMPSLKITLPCLAPSFVDFVKYLQLLIVMIRVSSQTYMKLWSMTWRMASCRPWGVTEYTRGSAVQSLISRYGWLACSSNTMSNKSWDLTTKISSVLWKLTLVPSLVTLVFGHWTITN